MNYNLVEFQGAYGTSSQIPKSVRPEVSFVGRSNVGKSSLINAFIGEDRHIVTDIAGTTRDSIYTKYNKFGLNFYLSVRRGR